jgi:hypothetical protein
MGPGIYMRLEHQVCAVSKRLFLGPFLTPTRAAYLRTLGVTHVLNVGEAPSVVTPNVDRFIAIRDCANTDLALIPGDAAIRCITTLHEMLQQPTAKVYVHCIAGQNRSPTILWLYLIARGMPATDAKALIECHAPDAVPGHKSLADDPLVSIIKEHGRAHFERLGEDELLSIH